MALYNFRDTSGSAGGYALATEELTINNELLEDYAEGYRTLYVSGRESLSADVALIEGGKHNGDFYNYKRYPARVITVGFQLLANSAQEYRTQWNMLAEALNVENAQIVFLDEPDKFFIGTPGEISEIEPGKNKIIGEFQIVCADPFKYSIEEHSATIPTRYSQDPVTIQYNGTVPTQPRIESKIYHEGDSSDPWGAASYFEYYAINDKVLTYSGAGTNDEDTEQLAVLDTADANPTSGGWTRYYRTTTFEETQDQAMCEGFFDYATDAPTVCYRFRAALTVTAGSPMIEVIRDYWDGIPQTELRFKIDDEIVYTEYLDDKNGGKFPFRISFEHLYTYLSAVKRGYMVCVATFQFGDYIFTYKYSRSASTTDTDNRAFDVKGASIERAKYFESIGNLTGHGKMSVVNRAVYNQDYPMLYGVPHVVDVENGKLYLDDLFTPYPNNPANDYEGFELVPGSNKARCYTAGIGSGYFTCVYKWREKYL